MTSSIKAQTLGTVCLSVCLSVEESPARTAGGLEDFVGCGERREQFDSRGTAHRGKLRRGALPPRAHGPGFRKQRKEQNRAREYPASCHPDFLREHVNPQSKLSIGTTASDEEVKAPAFEYSVEDFPPLQVGKGRQLRERHAVKFDSTRGYPGEGPHPTLRQWERYLARLARAPYTPGWDGIADVGWDSSPESSGFPLPPREAERMPRQRQRRAPDADGFVKPGERQRPRRQRSDCSIEADDYHNRFSYLASEGSNEDSGSQQPSFDDEKSDISSPSSGTAGSGRPDRVRKPAAQRRLSQDSNTPLLPSQVPGSPPPLPPKKLRRPPGLARPPRHVFGSVGVEDGGVGRDARVPPAPRAPPLVQPLIERDQAVPKRAFRERVERKAAADGLARRLEGLPAAEAIRLADLAEGRGPALDVDDGREDDRIVEDEEAEKRKQLRVCMIRLRNYVVRRLSYHDPSNNDSEKIIIRGLHSEGEKCDLQGLLDACNIEQMAAYVEHRVYVNEVRIHQSSAFVEREDLAVMAHRSAVESDGVGLYQTSNPWAMITLDALRGRPSRGAWAHCDSNGLTGPQRTRAAALVEPASQFSFRDRKYWIYDTFIRYVMGPLAVAMVEECLKRWAYHKVFSHLASSRALFGVLAKLSLLLSGVDIQKIFRVLSMCAPALAMAIAERKQVVKRFVAHLVLTQLKLCPAVVVHAVWNAYCLWKGNRGDQLSVVAAQENPEVHAEVYSDTCLDGSVAACPTQEGFTFTLGEKTCVPKFGLRCCMRIGGVYQQVLRQCSCNQWIGLTQRVGKCLPMHKDKPAEEAVFRKWKSLRSTTDYLCGALGRIRNPMRYKTWLARYTGPRRRFFAAMKATLNVTPGKFIAKSFIKREKSRGILGQPGKIGAPRVIQGCPEILTHLTGQWCVPLAKRMHDRLGVDGGHIVYTCGMTGEQIGAEFGKAIDEVRLSSASGRVVIVEDDQSRFDLHLGRGAFSFLDEVYHRLLPKRVARYLQRKRSQGVLCGGTKYSVPYTMQSGWPDTSLGDTLVNAAMKLYIHGVGRPWRSIICGDDSVTITTAEEVARLGGKNYFLDQYASFGMEVTFDIRDDPLDVGFCSGRFMPHHSSYLLVPKIGKMLGGIYWDTENRGPRDRLAWVRSVSDSVCQFGQVDPIGLGLGLSMRASVGDGKVLELIANQYSYRARYDSTTDMFGVYVYYDHHYGFSPGMVDDAVAATRLCVYGATVRHPLLVHLAETDC